MSASYIICLMTCYCALSYFKRWNIAPEVIRKEGPQSHYGKSGTPTMAGICFVSLAVIWMWVMAPDQWRLILCVMGFMMIGAYDDAVKITGSQRGLSMKIKMLVLLLFSVLVMYLMPVVPIHIPFSSLSIVLSKGWYIGFGALVLTASANAMNFTDGIDGLCASQFLLLFFGLIMVQCMNMTHISSQLEVSGYLAVGVMAFLYFNAQPAQMFMGDSGSLPLGALMGLLYIQSGWVLYFPWVAIILVAEVLSVIIQIIGFKSRGIRVFKMAPLHHHFELSNWSNMQILMRFSLVTIMMHGIFVLGIS